ncbi:MAG: hypothetical protein V3V31_01060 [Methylococcales bacterium]
MIGKSGQNGLFRSRFSILGQPPRMYKLFSSRSLVPLHWANNGLTGANLPVS